MTSLLGKPQGENLGANPKKRCFKCKKIKHIQEFYKHGQMSDGHLNKCKTCSKKNVHENYKNNRQHYILYDKRREQDEQRKLNKSSYQKKHRKNNPEKYKARTAVSNAIRDGRLTKKPCSVCGSPKSEAHHEDYSAPLKVIWFCKKHHLKKHNKQYDKE